MDSAENQSKNGNFSSEISYERANSGENATDEIRSKKDNFNRSTKVNKPKWVHDQDIGVKGLRDSLELIQGQVMKVVNEEQKKLQKFQKVLRRFKR